MRQVALVIMNGRNGESAVERMVDGARRAITCDLVDRALACSAFASIVVSTNDADLAETLVGLPSVSIVMDPEEEQFHFGKRLQAIIAERGIERVVYFGGGSAPLISAATLCGLAEQVRAADRLFLANNFYSVDFCAFSPASAILAVEPPLSDNGLGWLLGSETGLPTRELPRTAESVFDVDTPVDLLTLSLHPGAPARTRVYLDGLALDTRHIKRASAVFLDRQAEVLLSGRMSASTMSYVERESACRTRVFSEERGMRADGRLARGQVRSLLGMQMASVGTRRFFATVVPELGQAAVIDDRVLWAHRGVWPAVADRFHSDLLRPAAVADPFIREFTEAAMSCPIPVVLGGHSLVSGGLYVLIDAAWAGAGIELQESVNRVQE